jgi:D-glycero-alpha-D-manno-heptose-7-phosphate kinase
MGIPMIEVRAPIRISFGGGGTDLAAYYEHHGGLVVSAAITRYCRVWASPTANRGFAISSEDYGIVEHFPAGKTPTVAGALTLPKAAIERFGGALRGRGVALSLSAEAPPGSGLGSSSAMAVALLAALGAYSGARLDRDALAHSACELEIDRLGQPIGRQDQYASAFGGVNTLTFSAGGVAVEPLALASGVAEALEQRLLLFFTGKQRKAASILRHQQADSDTSAPVIEALHRIKELAFQVRSALLAADLDGFGALLHRGWQEKRRLSERISSPQIDEWYAAARAAGALGGKIAGAGGGGFLLLYCPPERQPGLRAAMDRYGLRELPFDFDHGGVQVERAATAM